MAQDLRPVLPTDPLDSIEDEVIFTISALRSDPRGAALAVLADGWLTKLEEVRAVEHKGRVKVVNAEARRVISNENLDSACEAFGVDLLEAVEGDKNATRWKAFFQLPVVSFVRLSLARQVEGVARWLERDDPVVDRHREALARWSAAARVAVEDTERLAAVRANVQIARERLAEDISRDREALHHGLIEIAQAEGLPSTWPEAFFYRGSGVANR